MESGSLVWQGKKYKQSVYWFILHIHFDWYVGVYCNWRILHRHFNWYVGVYCNWCILQTNANHADS